MLVQPPVGHWLLPAAQPFAGAGAGALTWDVGVVLLATGLAGLAAAGGRPRRIYGEAMRAATAWATVGIAATLAALAPHLQVAGIEPWALLCSLIPGLSAVRAPARLVLFSAFAVAVLAAPALGWLRQRWPRARLPITVACMALLAAEMWTMPVALVQPDVGVSDHDEPLRDRKSVV